jgi:hypothetical protein
MSSAGSSNAWEGALQQATGLQVSGAEFQIMSLEQPALAAHESTPPHRDTILESQPCIKSDPSCVPERQAYRPALLWLRRHGGGLQDKPAV